MANNVDANKALMEVRRLCGIKNLGNTCYANSITQCLLHTGMFRQYILSAYNSDEVLELLKVNVQKKLASDYRFDNRLKSTDKAIIYKDDIESGMKFSFINALGKTFDAMSKENLDITAKLLKETAGRKNEIFKGYQQHDSQEFLGTILNELHDELSTSSTVTFPNMSDEVKEFYNRYVQLQNIYNNTTDSQTKENVKGFISDLSNENPKLFALSKASLYWKNYVERQHSIVTDLFTGLYLSTITCEKCGSMTHGVEPFNSVSLPLKEEEVQHNYPYYPYNYNTTYSTQNFSLSKKQRRQRAKQNVTNLKKSLENQTLDGLLKEFVNGEKLEGDNQYHCDKCNEKVNATKTIQIFSAPNVLTVQLKRFITKGNSAIKNNACVDFPFENFDLSPYTSDVMNTNGAIYDLIGISNHSGSCHGGHYIAHCRNEINGKWYKFNDAYVSPVSDDKIKTETENAYILFYVKRSPSTSTPKLDDEVVTV